METLAHTFKALGEPVRLRILYLLMQRKSLCVCDLVKVLELKQSTVSRHLAYLKNTGWVSSFREGSWTHYQIKPVHLKILNPSFLEKQFQQDSQCQMDLSQLVFYETSPRKRFLPTD